MRRVIAVCVMVTAATACATVAGGARISPATTLDMTVTAGPGRVAMPNGANVAYARTVLTFAPPEIRTAKVTAAAPHHQYAKWFEPWEPWPRRGKDRKSCTIDLTPKYDSDGTLILGGLFRAFIADSLVVKSADGTKTFIRDKDFKFNETWGQIASIKGALGASGQKIAASCKYALQRLDLIQVGPSGKVTVKNGESRTVCPQLPHPDAGAVGIAGVYIAPWRVADNPNYVEVKAPKAASHYAITPHEIFPIAPAAPVAPVMPGGVARTFAKLATGNEVKIAFMGASITSGAEAGAWWDKKAKFTEKDKAFRGRVIYGLRKRFAAAKVTPIEAYKGGETAKYGLGVLERDVLPKRPDLVLMAFGGNDVAGPIGRGPKNPPEQFKKDMLVLVRKAKASGAEVMLVVTMQQNPWLKSGVTKRWGAYRDALLAIGRQEQVAVADVYTEWMNQASRGTPPFSQLHNWNNHPGAAGHKIYADVILRFFAGNMPATAAVVKKPSDGLLVQPTNAPSASWKLKGIQAIHRSLR